MIIKKTLNKFPFINLILKFLNRLVQILGSISLLVIILLIFHYFNSGMYERFKPLMMLKKIDKVIIDRYFGFSFFEIDDYIPRTFVESFEPVHHLIFFFVPKIFFMNDTILKLSHD